MPDGLSAPVPRRLRVRSSIQVAGSRVPARGFLVVMGAAFAGTVAVILGADLERVLWATSALALSGVVAAEGRMWGRSSREVAVIIARHLRRPRRMRLSPQRVVLPPETPSTGAAMRRRPRWDAEGDDARR